MKFTAVSLVLWILSAAFLYGESTVLTGQYLSLDPINTEIDSSYFQRYYIKDGVDFYTGQVAFSLPLYSIGFGGVQPYSLDLALFYDGNISMEVSAKNNVKQASWVGVGFNLSLMHIKADIQGTRDWLDDIYTVNMGDGQSGRLLPVSMNEHEFQLETYSNFRFLRIVNGSDVIGWQVTDEAGIQYTLGDMSADIIGENRSTTAKLGWNNWVGNGSAANDSRVATGWFISKIENGFGQYLEISYFQDSEHLQIETGEEPQLSSFTYTKGIFPQEIRSNSGRSIQFVLEERLPEEWLDLEGNHDERNGNADEYQESYDRHALDKIQLYQDGVLISEKQFGFHLVEGGANDEGKYKRFLTSLTEADGEGNGLPSTDFTYFGVNGDLAVDTHLLGRIQKIVYPTGGSTAYTYETVDNTQFQYEALGDISWPDRGWPIAGDESTLVFAHSSSEILIRSWNGFKYAYWDEVITLPFAVEPGEHAWQPDIKARLYQDYLFVMPMWEYDVNDTKHMAVYRKTPNGWHEIGNKTFENVYDLEAVSKDYVIAYTVTDVTLSANLSLFQIRESGQFVFDEVFSTIDLVIDLELYDEQNSKFTRFGSLRFQSPSNSLITIKDGHRTYALDNASGAWMLRGPWPEYYDGELLTSSWSTANTVTTKLVGNRYFDGEDWQILSDFVTGGCTRNQLYYMSGNDLRQRTYHTASRVTDLLVYADFFPTIGTQRYYKATLSFEGDFIRAVREFWKEECTQEGLPCLEASEVIFFKQVRDEVPQYINGGYYPLTSPLPQSYSYTILNESSLLKLTTESNAETHSKDIVTSYISKYDDTGGTWGEFETLAQYSPHYEQFTYNFSLTNNLFNANWNPDLYKSSLQGQNFLGLVPATTEAGLKYYQLDPAATIDSGTIRLKLPVVARKDIFDGYNTSSYSYTYSDGVYRTESQSVNFNKVEESLEGYGTTEYRFYNDLDNSIDDYWDYPDLDNALIGDEGSGRGWIMDGKMYKATHYAEESTEQVSTESMTYYVEIKNPNAHINYVRLDSENTILDGVTRSTRYEYNSIGQQSVKTQYLEGLQERVSTTEYAWEQYDGMEADNMLSQVYSNTIATETGDVEQKEWTTWRPIQNTYVPDKNWVWVGDGSNNDLTAPLHPGLSELESREILSSDVYDAFGNLVQSTNALGLTAAYLWGLEGSVLLAHAVNAEFGEIYAEPCEEYTASASGELATSFQEYSSGIGTLALARATDNLPGLCQSVIVDNWSGDGAGVRLLTGTLQDETNYVIEFDYKVSTGAMVCAQYSMGAGWQETVFEQTTEWAHARISWSMADDGSETEVVFRNASDVSSAVFYIDNIRVYPEDAHCASGSFNASTLQPLAFTDQNGVTSSVRYDAFGRLIEALNHDGAVLMERFYSFSRKQSSTGSFDPSKPNSIITNTFPNGKGTGDTLQTALFMDGLGRIRQMQTRGDTSSLVSNIEYNLQGRTERIWKPYCLENGSAAFDANYHLNAHNYYSADLLPGTSPFIEQRYDADPLARLRMEVPEGADLLNPAANKIHYGSEIIGGTLFQLEETLDENDNLQKRYFDKSGNLKYKRQYAYENGGVTETRTVSVFVDNDSSVPESSIDVEEFQVMTVQLVSWACTIGMLGEQSAYVYVYEDDVLLDEVGCNGSGSESGEFMAVPGKTYRLEAYVSVRWGDASASGSVTFTRHDERIAETQFEYDILGNLTQVTPPQGIAYATLYQYNPISHRVSSSSADAGTIRSRFDKGGNLRFVQSAEQAAGGEFTEYQYDGFSRLVKVGVVAATEAWSESYPDLSEHYTTGTGWKLQNYYDVDYVDSGNNYCISRLSKTELNLDADSEPEHTRRIKYDRIGLMSEELIEHGDLPLNRIEYSYDLSGRPLSRVVSTSLTDPFSSWYEYDDVGRLIKTFADLTVEKPDVPVVEYTYDAAGRITQQVLSSNEGIVETVERSYTVRDWLEQINAPDIPDRSFFLELEYSDNGNVARTTSQTDGSFSGGCDGNLLDEEFYGYHYYYDPMNRLVAADAYGPTSRESVGDVVYEYDLHGNILSLNRGQLLNPTQTHHYVAGTNKLDRAFDQQSENYRYNEDGSIVADAARGIVDVKYNFQNLPTQIVREDGLVINYGYSAAGNRLWKRVGGTLDRWYLIDGNGASLAELNSKNRSTDFTFSADSGNGLEVSFANAVSQYIASQSGKPEDISIAYTATEYTGGISIKSVDGSPVVISSVSYRALPTETYFNVADGASGTVARKYVNEDLTAENQYMIKDHLGNVCVVLDKDGTLISANDFFPYGKTLRSYQGVISDEQNKFKIAEKERDLETAFANLEGLDYFGARYFDAEIGNWWSVDPLAYKSPGVSPYVYNYNNPLRYVDPDGMLPWEKKDIGANNKKKTVHKAHKVQMFEFKYIHRETGIDKLTQEEEYLTIERDENGKVVKSVNTTITTTTSISHTGKIHTTTQTTVKSGWEINPDTGEKQRVDETESDTIELDQTDTDFFISAHKISYHNKVEGRSYVQAIAQASEEVATQYNDAAFGLGIASAIGGFIVGPGKFTLPKKVYHAVRNYDAVIGGVSAASVGLGAQSQMIETDPEKILLFKVLYP